MKLANLSILGNLVDNLASRLRLLALNQKCG